MMGGETIPRGLLFEPEYDYRRNCIRFEFWNCGKRQSAIVKVESELPPDIAVRLFKIAWPKLWLSAACTKPIDGIVELDFKL